jgi:hypothetical protein
LTAHLNVEAENLKGQVMVFMLVTSAKEWLENNELSAAQVIPLLFALRFVYACECVR